MTRVVCTADIHEHLPEIPECDLLLIAGDVSFALKGDLATEHAFLEGPFAEWLERVPAAETVLIAGNHDQSIEAWGVPAGLRCHYLEDAAADLCGLKVWGTPWQPWFFDWAFNLHEPDLAPKWRLIPEGTDVLVLHGPPHCYGDGVPEGGGIRRTGSPSLLERIEQVRPRLVVFGHIHEGRGEWRLGEIVLANVSIVNAAYKHVHPVWVYELEGR